MMMLTMGAFMIMINGSYLATKHSSEDISMNYEHRTQQRHESQY